MKKIKDILSMWVLAVFMLMFIWIAGYLILAVAIAATLVYVPLIALHTVISFIGERKK